MTALIIQSTQKQLQKLQSVVDPNEYLKFYSEANWRYRHPDLINREIMIILVPYKTHLKINRLKKELFNYYDHVYLIKGSKKDYYKDILKNGIRKIYESI